MGLIQSAQMRVVEALWQVASWPQVGPLLG
jgi:hypothetical protein